MTPLSQRLTSEEYRQFEALPPADQTLVIKAHQKFGYAFDVPAAVRGAYGLHLKRVHEAAMKASVKASYPPIQIPWWCYVGLAVVALLLWS